MTCDLFYLHVRYTDGAGMLLALTQYLFLLFAHVYSFGTKKKKKLSVLHFATILVGLVTLLQG